MWVRPLRGQWLKAVQDTQLVASRPGRRGSGSSPALWRGGRVSSEDRPMEKQHIDVSQRASMYPGDAGP